MADYTLRSAATRPRRARRPTGRTSRSTSTGTAPSSTGSCRPRTARTPRSASAARAAPRSAAPAACASTASRNLACHMHLDKAAETALDGVIIVEPMGNMPVIKDLIVDMDAVHWKKIQRVTPWLIPDGDEPEREYIVPPESMIDVTQTMACIQCGACVSDCLSMEVDPLFIGPAALAKAYRFVGDPRDGQQYERLKDLVGGPARDLRLHPLLQLHRGVPEGRRADEPDHAAAPDRRRRPRDQRPQQRPPAREGVRQERRDERPAARGRPAAATPTAASSTRAPSPSWAARCRRSSRRCSAAR